MYDKPTPVETQNHSMRFKQLRNYVLVAAILAAIASCQEEKIPEPFIPRNDHEAYEKALERANLLQTALGKDWQNSANEALEKPLYIDLPYEEAFFVDDKAAKAIGYRFEAKRGQKIQISLQDLAVDSLSLFIDLFRVEKSSMVHVATADSTHHVLGFEPRKDSEYVLRFQTELLRGGSFKITFESVPTLSFPVAGLNYKSIGSVWGDPRDGGARSHEGVDIFAPIGTPVVAPTDGYIKVADERGIGGKVIWLEDHHNPQSLYFAHLSDWNVKRGDRVKAGDTIGFVGNTGNASTTPPHLHFGVYSRGAMNPINHLKPIDGSIKVVHRDLDWLGETMRMKTQVPFYADVKSQRAQETLERNQVARVLALNAARCKIELPDGRTGYIPRNQLLTLNTPISRGVIKSEMALMAKPDPVTTTDLLLVDEQYKVLGKNKQFLLVETNTGKIGWIGSRPEGQSGKIVADKN